MPRFPHTDEAFLKRTMLPRAHICIFTKDDVNLITKETGMDESRIQHWAANLRWRMSINGLPGSMGVEEFLKTSSESLSENVT